VDFTDTPEDLVVEQPASAEPPPDPPAHSPGETSPTPAAPKPARRIIAALVAAAVIGVGGFVGLNAVKGHKTAAATVTSASANGARPPGGPGGAGRGTNGTLASVSGSTFIVANQDGTSTKVVTDSSTRITMSVAAAVGDVKQGDNVVVTGTSTGSNAIAAQRISVRDAAAPAPGAPTNGAGRGARPGGGTAPAGSFAAGSVTSVSGGTLTVKDASGTAWTVTTSTSTTVTKAAPTTLSALVIGQPVQVMGAKANDGTVTATSVQQGNGGGFAPRATTN
jgi:hypothetical protein